MLPAIRSLGWLRRDHGRFHQSQSSGAATDMTRTRTTVLGRATLRRSATVLLAVLALCLPAGGRFQAMASPLHAQPALLRLAAAGPTTPVAVIVQATGPAGGLERRVT